MAAMAATCHFTYAATISKANNSDNLSSASSWSGGPPGSADIASWSSTVMAANSTVLGADLSWKGIQILSPGGLVTIGAGNTLTLASSGIDMATAGQNLAIGSGLSLAQGGQTWNVATGRDFTLTGALTRVSGASLNIDRSINTGTVTASPVLVNNILGPWASITSAGSSGGALAAGDTYATVTAGALAPYTGATQLALATAWGGMPSGGAATINYDLTSSATFGSFGLARFANTVRYTGPGAARQPGNTANGDLFTMNGFMNAGAGVFTFGTAGNVDNDRPYNVLVGPTQELALTAMSGGITFLNTIKNSTAGASGVTINGRNTVTFSGVNAYTGATVVAGGTLLVNGTGSINTSSGLIIRGANAKYLHTGATTSTVPVTLTRGTLDGVGSVGAVTVGNGTGGILTHGNGGGGILNLASLTFGGAGAVNAVLAAGTSPIVVSGALGTTPANGQVTLNVTPAGPLANGTYNVMSFGSFTGAASNFTANVISGLSPRQSAVPVLNGSNIAIQVAGDSPKWTGARNDGNWTTTAQGAPKNWKLITGGTTTDFIAGDNVLFDDTSTGTTTLVISDGSIAAGIIEFNNSAKNYRITSPDFFEITAGSLVKNGTGALSVENPNTYGGGTTFNGGTLNVNDNAALGTGPLTIAAGSAKTLNNTSGGAVFNFSNNAQNWNDDFTFTGSSDIDYGLGTVTLGGAGTDRTVTTVAGTLSVGELKATAHGFIKQGAGTLTLGSAGAGAAGSSISGTLNAAAGTLQINRTGSAGVSSGDFVAGGITGTGTITNGAADERWVFVNTTGTNTFNGTLANGGAAGLGFNKQGTGSVTLAGNLSYTGATTVEGGTLVIPVANSGPGTNPTVNAGTLVMAHPSAFGAAATIRLAGNAVSTLDIATDGGDTGYGLVFGTTTNSTIASNRATPGTGINHTLTTIGANGVGGGTLTVTSGVNVTSGTGRITLAQLGLSAGSVQTTVLNPTTANLTVGAVSKVANNFAQTLELGGTSTDNLVTGVISSGAAMVSITKSNSSTWTLSNTNTYTGNTQVGAANAAGVLRATASGALGAGTVLFDQSGGAPGPTSRLELSNDITLSNPITLSQRNNNSAIILNTGGSNVLSGNMDVNVGGTQATIQSDAGLLTLSGGISTTGIVARNLHLAGTGNGAATGVISNNPGNPAGLINLTKDGAGTWTVSGVNTFTGTTTINGGTLAITGDSPAATGAVTVVTGATLGGNGDLGGAVTVGAGAHHSLAVAATPGAQVTRSIGGVLDLTAVGDILDLTAAASPAAGSYILVTAAGGITGHTGGTLTDTVVNLTGLSGSVTVVGNDLVLTVSGGGSPYNSWASSFGLNPATDGAAGVDKDDDGSKNGTEFILGGSPVSGSNNPKVYSLLADTSADVETSLRELVLTIAVPVGTPAFSAGSPTSTATFNGYLITVRGSLDLATFPTTVTPVDPVTTGLPAAPVQGGITYEYRSFSLGGSNGTTTKGFLQVGVTIP